MLVEEKYFDFSGICLQVNHSLDPELAMCVIECLGFLTTDTVKPPTVLWIKFYFRHVRKGLWNLKVNLMMDLHQITHVSFPWGCVCNFSWNGQNHSEFTLQSSWRELLSTLKPCLRNRSWKCSHALDGDLHLWLLTLLTWQDFPPQGWKSEFWCGRAQRPHSC